MGTTVPHRYSLHAVSTKRGPKLTVDIVIQRRDGSMILIKRRNPPYRELYALPGGFVEEGETVEAAAIREAEEETGLKVKLTNLVGAYSDPNRDPRGHTVSIAYLAQELGGTLHPATDAAEAKSFKIPPSKLAFDHNIILQDALKLMKNLALRAS